MLDLKIYYKSQNKVYLECILMQNHFESNFIMIFCNASSVPFLRQIYREMAVVRRQEL
jgi:hypothetical protein